MKTKKTIKATVEGWAPSKTPNKRAEAVRRKLAFLKALHAATEHGWRRIKIGELGDILKINCNTTFLIANGIIERRGRSYRWRGAPPSPEMAEKWCDYLMAYSRRLRDRSAVVPDEIEQTFEAMETADKRLAKIEAALVRMYLAIRGGYRKIGLTELCASNGLDHHAGRHLISRGLIDRPRHGVCKWVGPPPDQELALWLYGMLAEHHRAIYRSKLDKKAEHTAQIDEMVGRVIPEPKETDQHIQPPAMPAERASRGTGSYWRGSTTTW